MKLHSIGAAALLAIGAAAIGSASAAPPAPALTSEALRPRPRTIGVQFEYRF